jgi:crossover junction endodeoxyribonuclease RusA
MVDDRTQYAQGPVTCFVAGRPRSKGSTVSFVGAGGRVITKADSKSLPAWCASIGWTMKAAMQQAHVRCALPGVPVWLRLLYYFPGADAQPHIGKPDLDKLQRAVFDALTGVLYDDDSQVQAVTAEKWTCAPPDCEGVQITATFGQRVPGARHSEGPDARGDQTRQGRSRRRRDSRRLRTRVAA